MSEEIKTALASEASHWYFKDGRPCYEIQGKNGNMRPTTLADARKLGLVPSVTKVQGVAAKPGLEIYKATQLLESSMTLPMEQGEVLDAYALRVVEDAKQHSIAAMGRGKECHAALENAIQGKDFDITWRAHVEKTIATLSQYGIDLFKGRPEHSFASPLGYGGKVDFHDDKFVIDWKTKDKVTEVVNGKVKDKKLAWPENVEQLVAYDRGLVSRVDSPFHHGLINVYIGVEDMEIRVHEWNPDDCEKGWEAFKCLLKFWQIRNNYNGQTP